MKRQKTIDHHSDPIRIVPLHGIGNGLAPIPGARLTYRKGPLLRAVEVFTINRPGAGKQTKNCEIAEGEIAKSRSFGVRRPLGQN